LEKKNRRLLTPAFHFQILKGYIDVYNFHTKVLINKIAQYAKSGEEFDIFNLFTLLTLDIIGACAFGANIEAQSNAKSEYVEAVKNASNLIYDRIFLPPILGATFLYKLTPSGIRYKRVTDFIHDLPAKVIADRKRALAAQEVETKKRHLDFLDLLLNVRDEEGRPLDDKQIRDEVDTFMFEGHDTTAAALTWTTYMIASHKDVQEKLQQEVDEILGDNDFIKFEDLEKLEYTTMVLKESLRLYPSVPYITRKTLKETEICNFKVPSRTELFIIPYAIHRNKKYWGENAESFNPENFSKTSPERDPFVYIPFSAGNRNCIGQNFAMNEEKAILCALIKNYNMEVVQNHPVIVEPHLILRPKHGIKIKVTKR